MLDYPFGELQNKRMARFRQKLMIWLSVLLLTTCFFAQPSLAAYDVIANHPDEPFRSVLFRSKQSLRDRSGNSWQVVVFRYGSPEGLTPVTLRLVGFPGIVTFRHPQDLTLTSEARSWQAAERPTPQTAVPNVGEYDLTKIVQQLPIGGSLKLRLPLDDRSEVLRVPGFVVQEWQQVARAEP
ncbi:DUF3122 domain-containing protein [Leptolyngbya sp. FACHB-711]|uniref:DUF3122 domain-containing protein n=1 Tax=unclassified Leptolyngbya TaxID=2650499 RepID=UPI001689FAAC|nr:DUF3122 domain-containing protein [Leptolyngbya sp. FACHB-711]MBD2025617.1 DUF3122 domain-containing protein [Leptolyngbya sp. FACHB-711]